ncbi:ribosomal RNA small subunit methyltransferase NEP1-like [Chenopodium quinoa]|uniref:ribosomal RNA small subunit methyltransferase NEP1-like n=1 Tax=Chenopodium quinoa TaxID=63459 RepID=UPI000B7916DA|nr:ribosomal RNA small subunit methyltransferase NEP1-like [Chenopodium quinoa]XP_021729444.1 ribosomal RNA small subunit methyltransferase NEP1-like [Chenopodium quinoa]
MVQEDVPAAATIEETAEDDKVAEDLADDIPGIPVTITKQMSQPGAVFMLERASLEVAKVGKTYQILNSEDHANFLMKHKKNPADYRPDIVHQALLMILDSPLNKAGRIQSVYVKTEKGVLFEVKPHVRIPRTYKRFAGIMLQLLQKLSISAAGKRDKLFRVVKNPVTQYLPLNSRKIGFSFSSEKLVDIQKYVDAVKDDSNFVFVVGAMAHGKVDDEYVEDYISSRRQFYSNSKSVHSYIMGYRWGNTVNPRLLKIKRNIISEIMGDGVPFPPNMAPLDAVVMGALHQRIT